MSKNEIKTVLAGNPNCGKSTVFNHLTGAKQTIGNFPGVTVERYQGRAQWAGNDIDIIDLPGLYSLTAMTDEERVAGDYLSNGSYDVIVNILDASNLERNLYLTLLLKELGRPMFVVLNMIDVARRRGMEISAAALSGELGVPVLETIGSRGVGIDAVLAEIVKTAQTEREKPTVSADRSAVVTASESESSFAEGEACRGFCRKSCRKTSRETGKTSSNKKRGGKRRGKSCECGVSCRCSPPCQIELSRQMAMDVARYKEISRICVRSVRSVIPFERRWSDRVDAVLTNRYLGIPIFLLAMYVVFQLTFTLGQYPMDWLEIGFGRLADSAARFWPEGSPAFLKSLISDGIIGGVGGVIVFLPNILLLFLAVSILEDSGYMARAALLSDRWMHKIGLPGKSIVPLLVGFGCTVPALMATRILTDRKERLTTMFVLPLFSCGARFPIYALLIPAFFPVHLRGPILWSIYFIGIALAVLIAKVISGFFIRGEEAPFIIELPPYHFPTFRTVGIRTLERGGQYLKKAGTVILGISIILWFLTSWPRISPEHRAEFETRRASAQRELQGGALDAALAEIDHARAQANLSESCAGRIGHFLEPVLRPMGFDWKIGTALVGAVAAKEVFVAQLGIVYSIGDGGQAEASGLADILARHYSPLTGFCVMLFCLIATPCMATFAMMAKEAGSWKWGIGQWLFLTGIAWIITVLTYQLGRLFLG